MDLSGIGSLEFEPVDWNRYPCLKLAKESGERGGTYPAVLSAADECAVDLFLQGRIGFLDIPSTVARVLEIHDATATPDIDDILAADMWAREAVMAGI